MVPGGRSGGTPRRKNPELAQKAYDDNDDDDDDDGEKIMMLYFWLLEMVS